MTPLRDLRPPDPAPRVCVNCWCSRFAVVIVRRVPSWACVRCDHRPAELAALRAAIGGRP